MTANEHATRIKKRLRAVERAHPDSLSVHRLHAALHDALVELGPGAGMDEGEVVVLGGGTNKEEDEELPGDG